MIDKNGGIIAQIARGGAAAFGEGRSVFQTRVLPRLVLKYTLRAAHLELGGAEQEVRRGGKP